MCYNLNMEQKILDKINEFKTLHPDKQVIIAIQTGSHLFKLNTPNSDLDITGIYLPSEKEFLTGKFSKEISLNTNKSNTANTKDDIDCKFISLFRFLELLAMGEFNALEWLYSPEYSHIEKSELWDEIQLYRDNLVIFNISSFLGFIKTEYKKAGFSGNIVHEINLFYEYLKTKDESLTLGQVFDEIKNFSYIKFTSSIVNNSNKHKQLKSIIIGHRVFQETVKIFYVKKELASILENKVTSHRKDLTGKDAKGLYHSQRLLFEAKYLLNQHKLQIPFSNEEHSFLMKIRKNEISLDELQYKIEQQIDEIKQLETTIPNLYQNSYFIEKFRFNLMGRFKLKFLISKYKE